MDNLHTKYNYNHQLVFGFDIRFSDYYWFFLQAKQSVARWALARPNLTKHTFDLQEIRG